MGKEYFESTEFNKFAEYKKFKAEEYRLPLEFPKTGPETTKTKEENDNSPKKPVKKHTDKNLAEKLKDKLSSTTTHTATHVASAITTTAVTGTVAAVTIFTPIGAPNPDIKINEIVMGENSVYYSIFAGDLNEKYNYLVEIKNTKQNFSFPLVEGINENVVEGLLPGYEYTISMVGMDENNIKVEYNKQKFYTLKEELPKVNFTFTKHQQIIRGYSLEYSIDISDKKNKFDSFVLNATLGDRLLQETNSVDGLINGTIEQVPSGKIDFSIFGIVDNKKIFITGKEYVVEEPSYLIELGTDYIFSENGKVQIPYKIITNEMADQVISMINFDLDFHMGFESSPERMFNVKANEVNYLTLSETPVGATKVSITPKLYISGGEGGEPVTYLPTTTFDLPYKLDVTSKQVFINKLNPSEKTLSLVFGMHDNINTKLFIKDNSGVATEVLGGRYETTIDSATSTLNLSYYKQYEDGTTSAETPLEINVVQIPDYTFNYTSELYKIFYTYNNDGTFNAYFDMHGANGEPCLSNNNLYYNIVLMDGVSEKTYSFTDDIAIVKNLESSYSIEYQVCQDIGDVTYIFQKTAVSGSIPSEPNPSGISGAIMPDGDKKLLTINIDPNALMFKFDEAHLRLSNGTIKQLTEKDFTVNEYGVYKLNLQVDKSVTDARIGLYICSDIYQYNKYNDLGLIIGTPYKYVNKIINDISSN